MSGAIAKPEFHAITGTREHARLPLALLAALGVMLVATGWAPPSGRLNWFLEVVPGIIPIAVFALMYKRFPLSHFVCVCWLLHMIILTYGGYYTYALTPLGNWAREAFHLHRNHYDRIGHLALGFFPAFTIREVLLRKTPLAPGGWLTFIVLSIVLAIGAFWELVEWWTTLAVASDVGAAYLGSQGDVWDAQWDMFLALVGAAVALPLLSKTHDASMRKAGIVGA